MMKEKKGCTAQLSVLVTGGTGFIGSHLLRRLTTDGCVSLGVDELAISALVRSQSASKAAAFPKGVNVCTASLENGQLGPAVRGVDVVVHLAAMMDFYPRDVDELYRVNVEGTRNLLAAFAAEVNSQGRKGTFIYISTTETIGGVRDSSPGDEDTELLPVYEYGKSKVAAEKVVKEESERLGLDYIILRPTGVLGPGDFFTIFELMEMINSGLLCFIPGSGTARLMYTHVEDVVQSIVKAIELREKCKNETFIICPDEALTYKRWIEVISEELGRAKPSIHLPFPVVRLATAMLAPLMNRGKARTFMYQVNTVNRMSEDRVYTNDKARRLLGFKPQYGLEEAIRQTVRYNLCKGHIKKHFLSPVILSFLIALLSLVVVWRVLLPLLLPL